MTILSPCHLATVDFNMPKRLIFLLGGARSGKSQYAEQWVRDHSAHVLFVATAQAFDDDMRDRIARHRQERPAHWQTLEAPMQTGTAIAEALAGGPYDTVLLDCLTLLAANLLLALPEETTQEAVNAAVLAEIDALLEVYNRHTATWLVVSNEVGMGVVPPTKLGRLYRDALGRANQRIAQHADEVFLLVAGLPWRLKP
jgi:adenosylcobinamide kinase/adenosylcobinamide-phosphate guanylyltransferase